RGTTEAGTRLARGRRHTCLVCGRIRGRLAVATTAFPAHRAIHTPPASRRTLTTRRVISGDARGPVLPWRRASRYRRRGRRLPRRRLYGRASRRGWCRFVPTVPSTRS